MRRALRICLIAAAVLGLARPAAAQPQFPERGTAPVVDAANIIDDAAEAALTQKLDAFEERSGRQFVVATIPDLQGYEISDYGYQLGRAWGLGDKENNDGVLLIVAPNERRMRIEVGYGLEAVLPDGLAYEYIEAMKPYFKAGDYSGGIARGADLIMTQLALPPEAAAKVAQQASEAREKDGGFPIGTLVWGGFILFFFILPMFGRGRRRRGSGVGGAVGDIILWSALGAAMDGDGGDWGGGGFGGGGGGFGGFSGGGGSFGGGGASGGW